MKLQKVLSIFTLFLIANVLNAEVKVESSIDWQTGRFAVMASRTLDPGMSPSDHPKALTALERELLPFVVEELGGLVWDNRGTLKEYMDRDPSLRTSVEALAGKLTREWSRLSEDRKAVEASYTVMLGSVLHEIFLSSGYSGRPEKPVGWVPAPEDAWTGIVIYVPSGLPVRGTGLKSDPLPALYSRILSDDLEVLADPTAGSGKLLSYSEMENRAGSESLSGRRPYRVMARELYGEYPCDIILSKEDTKRILAADSGRQALSDGRILILLDTINE